jgi:hypothetical protein
MRKFARVLALVGLCHVIVSPAFADISTRLSNAQLTAASDVIVIGRAVERSTRWIERILVTAVTVEVSESLKGGVAGRIEVLLPGGADANRRIPVAMTYAGAPQMQGNEEVFLFLTYDTDVNGYVVSGFAQGKFSIVTQRGTRMINRDLRGSQLVEGTGVARGTVTLTPLADFRAEIAGYVGR